MMQKIWKIFEYGYLFIALVLIVETVINWNSNRQRAYLFLVFSGIAVFMYFFKKRFRKRIERREKK